MEEQRFEAILGDIFVCHWNAENDLIWNDDSHCYWLISYDDQAGDVDKSKFTDKIRAAIAILQGDFL